MAGAAAAENSGFDALTQIVVCCCTTRQRAVQHHHTVLPGPPAKQAACRQTQHSKDAVVRHALWGTRVRVVLWRTCG
jgi:hypothetical protein